MRAIYKIARLELSNLFYSPVAWLLLILFVFVTGMGFAEVLERLARQQELSSNGLYAISKKLFYFTSGGLWLKVVINLRVFLKQKLKNIMSLSYRQKS